MKKLFLLLLIPLLGCEKEEDECFCRNASMVLEESPTSVFYITNLPVDCVTGQPDYSKLPDNYWYINCE